MKFYYYFIILFFIVIYSCNSPNNKKNVESKNKILKTNEFLIDFRLTPYNVNRIRFYYPYEIAFSIRKIKTNRTLDLVSIDSVEVMYSNYKAYSTCRYKNNTYNMYVYQDKRIHSEGFKIGGQKGGLIGYFIDFPLYDSLYSRAQFVSFIDDFKNNAKFYIYTHKNNTIDSIKLSNDSLKFKTIMGEKRTNLKTNMHQIGYPDSIQMKDKSVWTADIGVY